MWLDEKPDEYFFLEIYASAVVEQLITLARSPPVRLGGPRNTGVLPHYSPGVLAVGCRRTSATAG
ncbi:MAG: hypothetical protein WDO73_15760, partial [Ignavibacteriota bacterium]